MTQTATATAAVATARDVALTVAAVGAVGMFLDDVLGGLVRRPYRTASAVPPLKAANGHLYRLGYTVGRDDVGTYTRPASGREAAAAQLGEERTGDAVFAVKNDGTLVAAGDAEWDALLGGYSTVTYYRLVTR